MQSILITREIRPDGSLLLAAGECRYTCLRPRNGVLILTIAGRETGELGRAALGEVAVEAALHAPLRLFVDLSRVTDISVSVADEWTAWFQANRGALRSVHALTPTAFVRLTVAVSQLFSRTGDLIRIHTDAAPFAAALRVEAPDLNLSHLDL